MTGCLDIAVADLMSLCVIDLSRGHGRKTVFCAAAGLLCPFGIGVLQKCLIIYVPVIDGCGQCAVSGAVVFSSLSRSERDLLTAKQ